jgi:small-conductance mechanosensitive channel
MDYVDQIFKILNYNIFALGDAKITPLSILYTLLLTVVLIYLSAKLKQLLISRLLRRTKLDAGAQDAIGTITRYLILFVGFLIILQTVGINLTTLNVLAGAVGIGVGFGLQNIANNFISGLIILLERPIKVGDRIEVDDVNGRVVSIGARSTTVRTNDNIAIIVPNSKFISENVINWSFGTDRLRFKIPIGVGYDSDVDRVEELLIEAATENPNIESEPAPSVRFTEFGENALNFELRVWTRKMLHNRTKLKSQLNFAILRKLRENGVEIPFPQRDVHIRNGSAASES